MSLPGGSNARCVRVCVPPIRQRSNHAIPLHATLRNNRSSSFQDNTNTTGYGSGQVRSPRGSLCLVTSVTPLRAGMYGCHATDMRASICLASSCFHESPLHASCVYSFRVHASCLPSLTMAHASNPFIPLNVILRYVCQLGAIACHRLPRADACNHHDAGRRQPGRRLWRGQGGHGGSPRRPADWRHVRRVLPLRVSPTRTWQTTLLSPGSSVPLCAWAMPYTCAIPFALPCQQPSPAPRGRVMAVPYTCTHACHTVA